MAQTYEAYLVDEIEAKTYTAGDLAADWWWMDEYLISTRRAIYTDAEFTGGYQGVKFSRLEGGQTIQDGVRVITRYVDPDMEVRLVKRKGDTP